jgi:hypothetical protein
MNLITLTQTISMFFMLSHPAAPGPVIIIGRDIPVETRIMIGSTLYPFSGKANIHIEVSQSNPPVATVRLLNLFVTDPAVHQPGENGPLNLAFGAQIILPRSDPTKSTLTYDRTSRTFSGILSTQGEISYLLTAPATGNLPANQNIHINQVDLQIRLDQPLEDLLAGIQPNQITIAPASTSFTFDGGFKLNGNNLRFSGSTKGIQKNNFGFARQDRFKVVRNLCVQPIMVVGQAPGMLLPNLKDSAALERDFVANLRTANDIWRQVNINFSSRAKIDITYDEFAAIQAGQATAVFYNPRDTPDCVEVFYINDFPESSSDGGGNALPGGAIWTAVTIRARDINATSHTARLAHELGHAFGLADEDSPSQTVMRPSGNDSDNFSAVIPEHGMNARNPLFAVQLDRR